METGERYRYHIPSYPFAVNDDVVWIRLRLSSCVVVRFRQVDKKNEAVGVEYMVPVLGGLGREGVAKELPALLQVRARLGV